MCSFEDTNPFCGLWLQNTADQMDWILNRGSTFSNGTGPSSDHSSGNKHLLQPVNVAKVDKTAYYIALVYTDH